jgi:hypothetical protein
MRKLEEALSVFTPSVIKTIIIVMLIMIAYIYNTEP